MNRTVTVTVTVTVFCALLLASSASAQQLDSLLNSFEAQGFSGTVLVEQRGNVILHMGYGHADKEKRIKNAGSTRFEQNSLAKTFTAAAILKLQEQGKLNVNDPISKYLGEMRAPKDKATIHHLLMHTAGLVPDGADVSAVTRGEFINKVKRVPAESIPGEKYRYTNAGYSVLAAIIEVVSGMTYEDYLRRELFTPATIVAAHFRGEPVKAGVNVAKGYTLVDNKLAQVDPSTYMWGVRGAGGIYSTVDDMYSWFKVLQKKGWLEYSWTVEQGPYGKQIHKGGGSPSFASQIFYYPDKELLIIWASNDLTKRWRTDLNRAIPASLLK